MRHVEKKDIVSCEIAYIPIDSKQYLKEVDKVLELIEDSKLEYSVGILSTTIRGQVEKVFKLVSSIHHEMTDADCKYTMNIMISNICGCEDQ